MTPRGAFANSTDHISAAVAFGLQWTHFSATTGLLDRFSLSHDWDSILVHRSGQHLAVACEPSAEYAEYVRSRTDVAQNVMTMCTYSVSKLSRRCTRTLALASPACQGLGESGMSLLIPALNSQRYVLSVRSPACDICVTVGSRAAATIDVVFQMTEPGYLWCLARRLRRSPTAFSTLSVL